MAKVPEPKTLRDRAHEGRVGLPLDVCPTCREILPVPEPWDGCTRVPCHICDPEHAKERIAKVQALLRKEGGF